MKMYLCSKEISISNFGMAVSEFGMAVPNFGIYIPDFETEKNVTEQKESNNRGK